MQIHIDHTHDRVTSKEGGGQGRKEGYSHRGGTGFERRVIHIRAGQGSREYYSHEGGGAGQGPREGFSYAFLSDQ